MKEKTNALLIEMSTGSGGLPGLNKKQSSKKQEDRSGGGGMSGLFAGLKSGFLK